MKTIATKLPGLLVFEPKIWGDPRGYFFETWHLERYREFGVPDVFDQDCLSRSERGVLRGLHFQNPEQQDKMVTVFEGSVFDVAVDIRVGSPHFGQWHAEVLSSENHRQLWIPRGFAHGFYVQSAFALIHYKICGPYVPQSEGSIAWNDPQLAIPWPTSAPALSAKDSKGICLSDMPQDRLPKYLPKHC